MISRNTIDKVFETARVEEVIGEFVQLKKAGSNFKGLSPFSDEKSPSFMVSPVKQIWKDFSTGKGGNAVSFIMEHEHYSYPEAIKYLAKKYNIEIDETEQTDEQKAVANERESMYLVSEYARDYYHNILLNHPKGKAIGYSYFKERGFTDETIKKFELGYGLEDWDAFTQNAQNKGYDIQFLEKTGLTIVNETKQFDRFRGRVLFPIHSMSGRVLGFGGRILTNNKKVAKYLNSPESVIYHKSHILYGLYHAKQSIAKEDNCFLVEGYTDVISFSQNGVENVVASSGTALTPDQIRLVRRLTQNITILFDGDAAGIRASIRGIDLILEQGMNVKVLSFPEGDDPDSFSKRVSTDELKEYLNDNAQDFINFKVSLLMKDAQNDPVKKAGLIRDIVVSISKIPDRIQREVYIQECARIMQISENVLFSELAQMFKKEQRDASKKPAQLRPTQPVLQKTTQVEKVNELFKYEKEIIKILLLHGNKEVDFIDIIEENNIEKKEVYTNLVAQEIYLHLQDDEIEFTDELFQLVYFDVIHQLGQNKNINIDTFINHSNNDIASLVTNILMDDERYSLSQWEKREIFVKSRDAELPKMVTDTVFNLRRVLIDEKITSLVTNISTEETNDSILEEIVNYSDLKKRIFKQLNRVI
ncbi:DNA primase [Urechidicola croceus]|uniref:DNA primase n=1 Tax=Urechidicola croceus TaxID=1850246 RepID=A0A1D8P7T9_9FLAO|nr:DNA primase [Urechidicola croceus]AOW20630.1 DNA primase [Urechidicola croceus]